MQKNPLKPVVSLHPMVRIDSAQAPLSNGVLTSIPIFLSLESFQHNSVDIYFSNVLHDFQIFSKVCMTREHDHKQYRHATKTFDSDHNYKYLVCVVVEETNEEQNCDSYIDENTCQREQHFDSRPTDSTFVFIERMRSQNCGQDNHGSENFRYGERLHFLLEERSRVVLLKSTK
jgi:hypothetical protein